jgi:hypothetical protein
MKRFVGAALLAACFAGGAHALPITDGTPVGHAVWGNFVGNHTMGGPNLSRVALTGKNMFGSQVCFDRIETHFIAEAGGTGYSAGNGGSVRVGVHSLNADGSPNALVGGWTPLYSPNLVNGWITAQQTVPGTLWPELYFSSPACLSAGQKFALVYENGAGSPATNYMGVNTRGVSLPANSPAVDPVWTVWQKHGANAWFERTWPTESHVPTFRLCDGPPPNGQCIGQPYMERADPKSVGGSVQVWQEVRSSTTRTCQTLRLTLSRRLSTGTVVRLGVRSLTGGFLAGQYVDVSLSGLPVVGTDPNLGPFTVSEVVGTLPSAVTLTANTTYRLWAGNGAAGSLWFSPMQSGYPDYFETDESYGGTTLKARYSPDNDATRLDWDAETIHDLQFYCE